MLVFNSAPECFNRAGSFRPLGIIKFNDLFGSDIKKDRDHKKMWERMRKTLIEYCYDKDKSCYVLIEKKGEDNKELLAVNIQCPLVYLKNCNGVFRYDENTN